MINICLSHLLYDKFTLIAFILTPPALSLSFSFTLPFFFCLFSIRICCLRPCICTSTRSLNCAYSSTTAMQPGFSFLPVVPQKFASKHTFLLFVCLSKQIFCFRIYTFTSFCIKILHYLNKQSFTTTFPYFYSIIVDYRNNWHALDLFVNEQYHISLDMVYTICCIKNKTDFLLKKNHEIYVIQCSYKIINETSLLIFVF